MTGAWLSIVWGLTLGGGLLLIWFAVEARTKPLVDRLRPYHIAHRARSVVQVGQTDSTLSAITRFVGVYFQEFERLFGTLGSSRASVLSRQRQAGISESVVSFRVEQVVWAAVGIAGALGITLLGLIGGRSQLVASLALVLVAGVVGLLLPDWRLSRAARRRTEQITHEFPTIAELLALAVAAGESPMAGLARVVELTDSALSVELRHVIADVRGGARLTEALQTLGDRLEIPIITRFAEGVATALERGTALVAVLHDQAKDARNAQHHELMELGGKKELAMMVPLVFLILPITVVFALFPGLITLQVSL